MKKTHRIPAQSVLALSLLAALLLSSEAAAEGCRASLRVCARLILPSLFPFFVLSSYCTALGLPGLLGRYLAPFAVRLYGFSGAGASPASMESSASRLSRQRSPSGTVRRRRPPGTR